MGDVGNGKGDNSDTDGVKEICNENQTFNGSRSGWEDVNRLWKWSYWRWRIGSLGGPLDSVYHFFGGGSAEQEPYEQLYF